MSTSTTVAVRLPGHGRGLQRQERQPIPPVAARRPAAFHGRLVRDRQHSRRFPNAMPTTRSSRTRCVPDGRDRRPRSAIRKGSFDAPVKTHASGRHRAGRERQRDLGHAVHLADQGRVRDRRTWTPDYSQTIIGRSDRDYAWVMARTPTISEADYAGNLQRLRDLGYSLEKLRKVPQTPAERNETDAAR